MNRYLPAFVTASLLFASCHTFNGANGKKRKQLFPTRYSASYAFDTSKFVKQSFDLSDFNNKRAYLSDKRIVETIGGNDVQQLTKANGRYIVLFCYPCPGNRKLIHKMDSLGENAMLVWLTTDCNYIDATLKNTRFAKHPYYTIDAKKNSTILLERCIRFIKDACPQCYEQYKDEVRFTDYLLVENGTIKMVMENDSTNVLRG